MTLPYSEHVLEAIRNTFTEAIRTTEVYNVVTVTPKHLVIGLYLEGSGVASRILKDYRVFRNRPTILNQLSLSEFNEKKWKGQLIDQSASYLVVLDRANQVAQEWGDKVVETEHLLMSLLADKALWDTLELDPNEIAVSVEEFMGRQSESIPEFTNQALELIQIIESTNTTSDKINQVRTWLSQFKNKCLKKGSA